MKGPDDRAAQPQPRIAIFTHDTFGLGHVRRCSHIIRSVAAQAPHAAILLITGSPALHSLETLPPNADYIKIPTIAKTGSKGHQPPHLPLPVQEITLLRREMIREAVIAFAPDVLLVDNFPLGSQSELLPTLKELRRLPCRAILGLRDILDDPQKVQKEWTRQGMYEVLDRYYDRILVYGARDVFPVEEAYALPPRIAAKLHYCGYITAATTPARSVEEVRKDLGGLGPFLLATGGGGGDAYPLLKTFLEALPLVPSMPALVVTGPLMSPSHHARLQALADRRPHVVVRELEQDLPSCLAAAEVVVSMCGYNIAAEITALRARAIVVPRTWRYGEHQSRSHAPQETEEWEQLLRARALSKRGYLEHIEPEALTPAHLAERIAGVLARPRTEPRDSVDLRGLEHVTQHILGLASPAAAASKPSEGREEARGGR